MILSNISDRTGILDSSEIAIIYGGPTELDASRTMRRQP